LSRLNKSALEQKGLTIVEVVVAMALAGLMSITLFTFFNTSFSSYLALQKDGTNFSDLASQSARIANVMRGVTDIVSQSADDITCYAYFAPNDTYVSLIHYYKNAGNTKMYADVTRMTSNPPVGTPINSTKKTFTIIDSFYQSASVKTFVYLDDSGAALPSPITDEHTIKGIQINLAATGSDNSNQAISLQVSLRNRKMNL
jgi:hypothetical protein